MSLNFLVLGSTFTSSKIELISVPVESLMVSFSALSSEGLTEICFEDLSSGYSLRLERMKMLSVFSMSSYQFQDAKSCFFNSGF